MILYINFEKFVKCVKSHKNLDAFFGAKSRLFITYRLCEEVLIEDNKIEISVFQPGGPCPSYTFEKDNYMDMVSVNFKYNPLTTLTAIMYHTLFFIGTVYIAQNPRIGEPLVVLILPLLWFGFFGVYYFQRYILCRRIKKNYEKINQKN
tara:strand:+ start:3767 stop:4213 length:447 start_codon:yes stop_codon:yes gene_type:complete